MANNVPNEKRFSAPEPIHCLDTASNAPNGTIRAAEKLMARPTNNQSIGQPFSMVVIETAKTTYKSENKGTYPRANQIGRKIDDP